MTTTKVQDYAELVKAHRRGLGAETMRPVIYVEYGGECVATLFPAAIDKDTVLATLPLIAGGMDASALVLAMDARMVTGGEATLVNPDTGQPWAHGELEELTLRDPQRAAELGVVDTLVVLRAERGNEAVSAATAPYRVAAGTVDYLPTDWDESSDPEGMTGALPYALLYALKVPTMSELLPAELKAIAKLLGLSETQHAARQRCAVAREMIERGWAVMLAGTEDEAAIYREVFGRVADVTVVEREL